MAMSRRRESRHAHAHAHVRTCVCIAYGKHVLAQAGGGEDVARTEMQHRVFVGLHGVRYKIKNFSRSSRNTEGNVKEVRPVFRGPDTVTHKKPTDNAKKDRVREAREIKRLDGDWSATEINAVSSWRARGEPGGMEQLARECGRSLDTVRRNLHKEVGGNKGNKLIFSGGDESLLGTHEAV